MTERALAITDDPLEALTTDNPFPTLRALREHDPVHRNPRGIWVLSRHADVVTALKDSRFSSGLSRFSSLNSPRMAHSAAAQTARELMTFRDAPEHTRLRKLIAKVMSENLARDLSGRIAGLADELLAPHLATGQIDLLNDYAAPLPVHVIAEMLGVPPEDRRQLKAWSASYFRIFAPLTSADTLHDIDEALTHMRAYFYRLVSLRRQQGECDVISSLIAATEQDDRLSNDELVTTCILFFANGVESFAHLICNGIISALRDPETIQRLHDDPGLVDGALEEMMRYDSPAPLVGRTTLEPIELHGRTIPKGVPVYLLITAANHDPTVFADPDTFDIDRRPNPHIAFGGGPHACLGAGIARTEARIALSRLFSRTRKLAIATDTLRWRPNLFLRGVESLPMTFSPN